MHFAPIIDPIYSIVNRKAQLIIITQQEIHVVLTYILYQYQCTMPIQVAGKNIVVEWQRFIKL